MKLYQLFSDLSNRRLARNAHPMVVGCELVGLEIELENNVRRLPRSDYWVDVEDGSLRNNGREYIFRNPLGGEDLYKAVAEASRFFGQHSPDASWRCSTHIHLNVANMTVPQLKKLILLYTVYEVVMFKSSGMNRYKNNFCPAYGFAQHQITSLSRAWKREGREFIDLVCSNWSKYSSLNLLPSREKGSVEFRISNAMTTSGSLLRLCNRVLALKKIAMEWEGTEEELIAHSVNTPVDVVFNRKLVGVPSEQLLLEDVVKGAILANDIMHLRTHQMPRRDVSGLNMIPTVLNLSKMDAMIGASGSPSDSDMESLHLALREIRENRTWEEVPVWVVKEIIRLFRVDPPYVISREYLNLLDEE